uniref:Glycosyltransferase n=1 Tax=Chenopodium quinoa TaxID=63459 RepID=A0A803LGY3_CHEQI
MIPSMDMVRLFATRGLKTTIVTTPANVHYFAKAIKIDTQSSSIEINLLTIEFPFKEVGLPKGCENFDCVITPEMFFKFFKAVDLLQQPFTNLVEKYHPTCLVADVFFHWANSVASKFKVPRLGFHGSNYFSRCIVYNLLQHEPHKKLSSDSETFVVPGDLPHEVTLSNSELAPYDKKQESDYIDYYENVMGMKQWHIGPFSLYFNNEGENDVSECRRWLDEKETNSVIYVCFGSVSNVSNAQLHEIAIALEDLGQNFILVVREDTKEWIADGFEAKTKGRGLIIRGWAPQKMILNHSSVGGFVTHCGWNSILEGVITGVPMVTWPLHAEQFYNEKLVTDVLRIGSQVGSKQFVPRVGYHNIIIGNKEILKAMKSVMIGEEAQDMRNRVQKLKEMARKTISEGGSSYSQLTALITEIKSFKS